MSPAVDSPAKAKPYSFTIRGGNLAAMRDHTSKEILLAGPAGTGKSTAAILRLYLACMHPDYSGVRCLMLRKTRHSLTESGLVTFERDILRENIQHHGKVNRVQRHSYRFPRGSELVLGGLDDVGKIMSSDWDLIFVQEATECEEDEIEMLTTRLRNGHYPVQQLEMDCNPSFPTHWLKQRCDSGRTRMYETRHEDNPALFDWDTQTWTPRGREYLDVLERLTGPRLLRLRYGRWVQAEGVIYVEWEAGTHVINTLPNGERTPPQDWPVWLAVDFGYSALHPFVCLWLAQDPYGRLYAYREIHESGKLVEDFAREIKALCLADGIQPRRIICDHDAEGRGTLERYLARRVTPAIKETLPSIQAVATRLRRDSDGKPRLFVLRDSLVRRDPKIVELKRCCSLIEEMDSWCFVAGTMVETETGSRPIESVSIGDRVWTRAGLRRVIAVGLTQPLARTVTATFSDGSTLTGTPNHPVFSRERGWVSLLSLSSADTIEQWKPPSSSMASRTDVTQTRSTGPSQPTSGQRLNTARVFVVSLIENAEPSPVFNLTVEDQHEYYANGLLVHNCWEDNDKKDVPVKDQDDGQDALRYGVYYLDRGRTMGWKLERY